MTPPKSHPSGAPVCAIVAAAGSGTRLGRDMPKAFVNLGGRTLLERALDGIGASGVVDRVAVVVSEAMWGRAKKIIEDATNNALWEPLEIQLVLGGGERADSVRAGLQAMAKAIDGPEPTAGAIVLVHDAARCLTPATVFRRVVEQTRAGLSSGQWAGVIPALPVVDTIKTVDQQGFVLGTPARRTLRAVQTPQGFGLRDLMSANEAFTRSGLAGAEATDDASIMELAGHRVLTVAGDPRALKITTPEDYEAALRLLDRSAQPQRRPAPPGADDLADGTAASQGLVRNNLADEEKR
ncbi:2-C-methyl-D-erythritol 4-phosphate cytidylyltransferase [Corynebacterium heidelbergense]|uniref:2-C-methyl-D-erythritol 4-phosphate cytidylyltransferase n=1 Tax=Corynebacterium heidelbergense TaxID=2055947 RepID=A0A364VED7_9CORY|nr:2-C-methyl-D-erythritol 4-phosphate cytidylyltransferase [Corynebacterium heidelbergense]RAV34981.1 2-C-methyl-D-erythritol 4-phosphate cytidylyltransferase [Corynebacterium heidelbergense]WCZ35915.1 2-C-methyl-D-erythritol 4-phosphate cytidylyltransferase [Corynebacterium heidelbergense]